MKSILDYALEKNSSVFEAARKQNVEPSDTKVVQNGKVTDKEKALDAGEKPNAAKRVKWAVDEPTSDDALKYANKEDWTDNMKEIRKRLRTGLPFFILGHAGWGKTAIIKQIAKKFGYSIITVYLDKALPEDLNGIPVPMEGARQEVPIVLRRDEPGRPASHERTNAYREGEHDCWCRDTELHCRCSRKLPRRERGHVRSF